MKEHSYLLMIVWLSGCAIQQNTPFTPQELMESCLIYDAMIIPAEKNIFGSVIRPAHDIPCSVIKTESIKLAVIYSTRYTTFSFDDTENKKSIDTSDCSTVEFSISEQGRAYNIEIIDPLYPLTSDERILPTLQNWSFGFRGKLPKDAKFQQTICFRSSWN